MTQDPSRSLITRIRSRHANCERRNHASYIEQVVRLERGRPWTGRSRCCIRLAGVSPVAASAGAPRSRLRENSENQASERSVTSPTGSRMANGEGSEPTGAMRKRELCSPVTKEPERVEWPSPSFQGEGNRLRLSTGGTQDTPGVWKRARALLRTPWVSGRFTR